jgi:hypothetical protein
MPPLREFALWAFVTTLLGARGRSGCVRPLEGDCAEVDEASAGIHRRSP